MVSFLEQQGGRIQVMRVFVFPGLSYHSRSRVSTCLLKGRVFWIFCRIQERSRESCLHWLDVMNHGWTGNQEEWHDFTRRIIYCALDGLRTRGFPLIQLEVFSRLTIRGDIETRGMNLR